MGAESLAMVKGMLKQNKTNKQKLERAVLNTGKDGDTVHSVLTVLSRLSSIDNRAHGCGEQHRTGTKAVV